MAASASTVPSLRRPTVCEDPAATATMSRSAFAARFTELVGEPAMTYVTRWRMNTAVDVLSGGDATVAEVARRFGYRSEAAFARAFARVVGEPAGRVRRRAAARGPAGLEVFAEPV